jgi:aminodeoxyfutalosine deaminase
MYRYRARWVLPIGSPPLDDGWVTIADDRVVAVGNRRAAGTAGDDVDLGRVAVMPALVNAHTHLELSYLAGRVPRAEGFTDWIREVMRLRREHPNPSDPVILGAQAAAIGQLRRAGVGLVGDIGNTLVSVTPLTRAGLAAAVFHELLRFRASEAEQVFDEAQRRRSSVDPGRDVRVWPAAHAPYSVSARLFALIRAERERTGRPPTSVHLGESQEEDELLATGRGPFRSLLEDLGAWDDTWTPPGVSPVEYLERLGAIDARTLIVHGVQLSDGDLARIRRLGATLVTCPRSNAHVGVGDPPVSRFYQAGVAVAIGTDSLASAPDLGIFPELAAIRRLAPEVPARRLLDSATRTGARALGFAEWGTIAPGSRAALIAVRVPPAVRDVEEYLVNGIDAGDVRPVVADGMPA